MSNSRGVIHSASDDVSEVLDRAERNVRSLSEDPKLEKLRQRERKRQQKAAMSAPPLSTSNADQQDDAAAQIRCRPVAATRHPPIEPEKPSGMKHASDKEHKPRSEPPPTSDAEPCACSRISKPGKQAVDAKAEQTPAPNESADPPLQQPEVKGSDLHPLLSSWSSHRLEWIIGKTPSPSQARQQACAIRTDGTPASATATVPPSQGPKVADTNEDDLHQLLARTPTHHTEWIIGNASSNGRRKQAADQPCAAKTEKPLKSEWVLQTEHVKDARALTPPPKAEYHVERTQSDDMVTAKDGVSDATQRMLLTKSPAETRKSKNLSREVFGYDEVPISDEDVITPTTVKSELALKKHKPARRMSHFKMHRAGHPRLIGDRMTTERVSSGSDPEVMVARRRKHKRWRSAMDIRSSSMSRSLMRFRSCRIRARRKRRPLYVDPATRIRPTEEAIADDRVIELTPLKSPISIDSMQRLTRNGDQMNFRQVLRIYGSGHVEEPYAYIPRRTSVRSTRGVVTVKYGTNMIEIAVQNTDIQPSKRGRVGSWIFTPSRAMQKAPVVFGKTKIVEERGIAPFCISIAAPFWVTCHQEQTCSSLKGERIRESIEVRQCDGSGMPCYEMKALDQSPHPLFSEHIYLGRGVIRIDRSSYIPTEQKLTTFFAENVSSTRTRQYRIPLPWRGGVSNTKIPRAPPITNIRTTVRNMAVVQKKSNEQERITTDESTAEGASDKKKKKRQGRRRLPPPSQDVTGCNIAKPQHQDRSYDLKSKSRHSMGSSASDLASESELSRIRTAPYVTDLPVMGHKTSEMETNEVLTKLPNATSSHSRLPAKDAKQPPFLRVIRRSGSTKTQTEKSEKDQVSCSSSNKPTKDKQTEGAQSSSSTYSELGVASDRARNVLPTPRQTPSHNKAAYLNKHRHKLKLTTIKSCQKLCSDKITVQALPPVAIRLREPVRSGCQVSSKIDSNRSSAQRKTRSHKSSKRGRFIIHKEVGDPDVEEEYPKKKSALKSCASRKCHQK